MCATDGPSVSAVEVPKNRVGVVRVVAEEGASKPERSSLYFNISGVDIYRFAVFVSIAYDRVAEIPRGPVNTTPLVVIFFVCVRSRKWPESRVGM